MFSYYPAVAIVFSNQLKESKKLEGETRRNCNKCKLENSHSSSEKRPWKKLDFILQNSWCLSPYTPFL